MPISPSPLLRCDPLPSPPGPAARMAVRGSGPARSGTPDDLETRHAALLEPVLPLVGTVWQRARLSIGEYGRFEQPPGCRPEDRIELDLRHGERASLAAMGGGRIVLTYSAATLDPARAALVAIASHGGGGKGGWPIARDEKSLALLTLAERIAGADIPVLLEGPTGTGKEVLARFVHRRSARAEGPFVAVNCAAMPEAMLEGLLFGHRKGAFTGAGEAGEGLFRAADGGTLLLDEIGELPLALQAKLLRVLQEGEVLPLGETRPVEVDVRVVAATNRRLAAEVEAGRFREDLLYRLNVFPLEIAPLRDRPADIAPLSFGMLLRHSCRPLRARSVERTTQRPGPAWLSGQALALLEAHGWPGNVRELENVIRRAILLAGDADRIGSEHIVFDRPARAPAHPAHRPSGADANTASLSDVAFRSEAEAILATLEAQGGHRARTAQALGISERTLRYRLASMRESGLLAGRPEEGSPVAGGEA